MIKDSLNNSIDSNKLDLFNRLSTCTTKAQIIRVFEAETHNEMKYWPDECYEACIRLLTEAMGNPVVHFWPPNSPQQAFDAQCCAYLTGTWKMAAALSGDSIVARSPKIEYFKAGNINDFCKNINSYCTDHSLEVRSVQGLSNVRYCCEGFVVFEPRGDSSDSFFAKEYCKLREEYDRMQPAYESALKEIQKYVDHYEWHKYFEDPRKYGQDWVLVRVKDFNTDEVHKLPMIAENRNGVWWSDHDEVFGSDQLPFTVVEWRSIE